MLEHFPWYRMTCSRGSTMCITTRARHSCAPIDATPARGPCPGRRRGAWAIACACSSTFGRSSQSRSSGATVTVVCTENPECRHDSSSLARSERSRPPRPHARAGRVQPTAFTGERDEVLATARAAPHPREGGAQDAAVEARANRLVRAATPPTVPPLEALPPLIMRVGVVRPHEPVQRRRLGDARPGERTWSRSHGSSRSRGVDRTTGSVTSTATPSSGNEGAQLVIAQEKRAGRWARSGLRFVLSSG